MFVLSGRAPLLRASALERVVRPQLLPPRVIIGTNLRLKPEHSTECAARPHKPHEHDELA